MLNSDFSGICARLAEVRTLRYGERGRSSFARDLEVPVSTYVVYEHDRVPPVELLIRAAELCRVNLEWLLIGTGDRDALVKQGESPPSPDYDHLARKLKQFLQRRPDLQVHIEKLLELLEKVPNTQEPSQTYQTPHIHKSPEKTAGDVRTPSRPNLIPIIGNTAAGTARFWEELPHMPGGPEADALLENILEKHAQGQPQAGQLSDSSLTKETLTHEDATAVSLVQFSAPNEMGFLEFLQAPSFKTKYPQAVAWRIDGDSMLPRYKHGDLVMTSSAHPAEEFAPCVARQLDQIGVNCKIFQRAGDDILLVPLNEGYPVHRFPASQLLWAHRVLGSVRLNS